MTIYYSKEENEIVDYENFLNRPLHTLLDRIKVEVTSIKIATYKKNEFIEKNASYLPIACARIHLPSWEEYLDGKAEQRLQREARKVNA